MKLEIKSVFGIAQRATVEIDTDQGEIVLLASRENGAGKSSIIHAATCALLPNPLPPGESKKEFAEQMLNEGSKSGYIMLETADTCRQITYPDCEVKTIRGTGVQVDEWAAGEKKFMRMPFAERAKALVELTGAKVTRKMLEEEFKDLNIDEKEVKQLIDWAVTNGGTGASDAAKGWAASLKAEFKVVAGTAWGSNKGLTFQPQGYTADLEGQTLDSLQQVVAKAKAELEEAIGKAALHKAAGDKEQAAQDVGYWTSRIEEGQREAEAARAELTTSLEASQVVTCSGCGLEGIIEHSKLVESSHQKIMTEEQVAELKRKERDWQAVADNAKVSLGIAKGKFETAEGAGEPVDVEPFRKAVAAAELRLNAFRAKAKGTILHFRITDMLKAAEILAPDGLAFKVLLEGIKKLNDSLAKACDIAGWEKVEIDRELNFRYDGKLYHKYVASEGQRFRCDVTFQVLWAQMKEQLLILVDRADVLGPDGRNGLFSLLGETGTAALIGMRVDPAPDLRAAGLGRTYLVENGTAVELGAVPA